METQRLVLRPWTDADQRELAAFSLDPDVMHHFGRDHLFDDSRGRLDRMYADEAALGYSFRAVELKATGAIIGNCGLKPPAPHWALPQDIEIGWVFHRPYWGQGYAFEAASAVLEWGLELAPRVIAITAASNKASWGLMERLGMRHEPNLDYEHPDIAPGHFARRTLAYVKYRDLKAQ